MRDFRLSLFVSNWPSRKSGIASTMWHGHWAHEYVEAWCRCLQHWSGTDKPMRTSQLQNDRLGQIFGRFFWTDFLDGNWGEEAMTPASDGNPNNELGTKLWWTFHSIFLDFSAISKSAPKLHLRLPWASPRNLLHTPSLNLHNVPRALLPSVFLTLSLYLSVFLSVFWRELEDRCAREMVNADKMVHQLLKGGSS